MTFNNFFKSMSFRSARQVLEEKGLSAKEIVHRVPPAPARPSQVFAHDLIALIFIQWLDEPRYMRIVHRMLTDITPPPAPAETDEEVTHA